ncbi:MAG TPA: DUF5057 domain-containing protein [Mobilitalea sp.]|nr:DUF5057 domain-containing protein [Mobilitalea sp.]
MVIIMNSRIKGTLLVIIILAITMFMPSFLDKNYTKAADEADWSGEDTGGDGGAAFTIVEIIPYKGMGEIGYLIGGQEPVDKELMSMDTASGNLSFLGGAISVYPSYTVRPMPASGTPDNGWKQGTTFTMQDGYFTQAYSWNGARYSINTGTNYVKVTDGTGSYKPVLKAGSELKDVYYDQWEPVNWKNVNAYFVYGKPAGVALFDQNLTYVPYSVTKSADKTGDYDYDSAAGRFNLNKGYGSYDVIFIRSAKGSNPYYMRADYEVVEAGDGEYSTDPGNITYTAQTGGSYNRVTNVTNFTFTNDGTSSYKWVQAAVPSNMANYQNDNGKIWVRGQKVAEDYEATEKVELVNNEWFKRLALGIPSSQAENTPVRVITITPEELNKPQNQYYIEEADMFYINANYQHNQNYIMLYENYSYEGIRLPYNQKYSDNQNSKTNNLNFAKHDLNWDNVVRIFKRAAGIGCKKAAMVIDSTYYQDAINGSHAYSNLSKSVTISYSWNSNKATLCNLAKLYIMVYQKNMVDFYNSFMNPATSDYIITEVTSGINSTGSTGSFLRPDSKNPSPNADEAIYWNGNTFLPYGLNADGNMVRFSQDSLASNGIVNYNITATPTDLTDNVLTMNGSPIFTGNFTKPINIPDDSKDEAITHLSSLDPDSGLVSPGSITIADLNNVITNNGTSYDNTGGVSYPAGSDVQGPPPPYGNNPDDTTDEGTEDGNLRNYIRVLNIEPTADYTASENEIRKILYKYDVQIVDMTSMQFNGSIEDINAHYDMIYLGSGEGRFNHVNGRTDFNDANLDSSIYFSEGDLIFYSTTSSVRYRRNDITASARKNLEDFLAAGYPIILDSGMYQLSNVKSNTNIYNFIRQAKADTAIKNLLNSANFYGAGSAKQAFIARLKRCLNIVRPTIQLIQPILPEKSDVNYMYVNPDTHMLTIKFSLLPKGTLPSIYTYNAYLYLDKNGDGLFDDTEQLTVRSSDGTSWEGMKESKSRTYTYQYNMADLNGVYQWKVLIKRQDNAWIRGSVTGYVANSNKKDICILQIRDNDTSYNLENQVNNVGSLINKYAAQNKVSDYNLIFDTMTVDEFSKLYAATPYTTATSATTNKLSKYHLLIMDNPNNAIPTANGALANIKDEVDNSLSVIFTKNALGYDRQSSYYSSAKYSFQNYDTYNYINRNTVTQWGFPLQLYIYNNLSSNGLLTTDSAYKTSFLTKTNEGAITRYPYQINKAIRIAPNSYSNDVTVDLDLSKNQRLVGWYSLSDSKSPVVRNEGLASGSASDLYQGLYSSSPNDVKNNYYLFNNGPCYYSGINLSSADVPNNDDEIKLFVNTIIAAYRCSSRLVSTQPTIEITGPKPVEEADGTKSITVKPENTIGNNLILTFDINESSSRMDLTALLDDVVPSGAWADTVYEVAADGSLGIPIAIDNTSKVIDNKTYAIKIPVSQLDGIHTLKLTVTNVQGISASTEVTLRYLQRPVVTITKPVPIPNNQNQSIYVDMDYSETDKTEKYLEDAPDIRMEFKVENSLTDVKLGVISEGVSLTNGAADDLKIYRIDDGGTESSTPLDLTKSTPAGKFTLYIPMKLMVQLNSREFTITATDDYSNSGNTSVILLRRSLFPLD